MSVLALGLALGGSVLPAPNLQIYRSGARYGIKAGQQGGNTNPVVGGAAGSANSPMYACPIPIRRPVALSGLELMVGTAVAGVLGRMAFFGGDLMGGAGVLLAACAGEADMNGAANTKIPLSFAATIAVTRPGLYWGVSMFNGAAQPYSLSNNTIALDELGELLGATTVDGLMRANTAVQILRITSPNVDYGAGFPATFGTPTFGLNTPGSPYIGMIVA